MMIKLTPSRTRLMLRIRRLLTAKLVETLLKKNADQPVHLQWPEKSLREQADKQVTLDIQSVQQWPTRKLRALAAKL